MEEGVKEDVGEDVEEDVGEAIEEDVEESVGEEVEEEYAFDTPPKPVKSVPAEYPEEALEKGITEVSMEYSQPWEGGEKGAWTFKMTVTVK